MRLSDTVFLSSPLQVKSDIHAALSRQLEALRNREVWLLDRVDLALRMQDQLLGEHLTSLACELGRLQQLLLTADSEELSCTLQR